MLNSSRFFRTARNASALLALSVSFALVAPAQNLSGKVSGTVADPSNGVIQNATVIISNAQARTKDMTTTNAAGVYEFAGVAAGQTTIEVLKPGFAKYVGSLLLAPNQGATHNATLSVGSISERIDVTSTSPAAKPKATVPGQISVGGSMQASRILKMARPTYPPIAKSAGIEGAVLMEAVIGTDGSLMALRVMNSQIDPDLAKAAVEAVSQWKYEPTLLNGKPVEVITQITVNFQLAPQ